MTLRRKWVVLLSSVAAAYALLAPVSVPGLFAGSLGSIECAAPPYFDALSSAELSGDIASHENGMSALRQRAGLALAELQTRNAGTP
jgi:hypothetical protein